MQIPIVTYTPGTGVKNPSTETFVKYIPVVEEVTPVAGTDPFSPTQNSSPFSLMPASLPDPLPAGQRGLIALRINYPFQAAALTAYTIDPTTGAQAPVVASSPDGNFGPYAGSNGLGEQAALTLTVRPFRRVLSARPFIAGKRLNRQPASHPPPMKGLP